LKNRILIITHTDKLLIQTRILIEKK
jgi:hypothetical protein